MQICRQLQINYTMYILNSESYSEPKLLNLCNIKLTFCYTGYLSTFEKAIEFFAIFSGQNLPINSCIYEKKEWVSSKFNLMLMYGSFKKAHSKCFTNQGY